MGIVHEFSEVIRELSLIYFAFIRGFLHKKTPYQMNDAGVKIKNIKQDYSTITLRVVVNCWLVMRMLYKPRAWPPRLMVWLPWAFVL